jgi:hypothetical protein
MLVLVIRVTTPRVRGVRPVRRKSVDRAFTTHTMWTNEGSAEQDIRIGITLWSFVGLRLGLFLLASSARDAVRVSVSAAVPVTSIPTARKTAIPREIPFVVMVGPLMLLLMKWREEQKR